MNKFLKIILIITLIISTIVGMIFLFIKIDESKRQWCKDNPVECSRRAEETRKYLERERKKELNCGITMPGMDPGWGGWRCKYEDD